MTPKACPFCGQHDTEIRRKSDNDGRQYYVYCHCCETEGPTSPTVARVVESWNERHSPYQAEIDALKAELKQLRDSKDATS